MPELSTKEQIALAEQKLAAFSKSEGPEPGSREEAEALEAASMEVSPLSGEEAEYHKSYVGNEGIPDRKLPFIDGPKDKPKPVPTRVEAAIEKLTIRKNELSTKLDKMIKEEDELFKKITALKIGVAIDQGMFSDNSWALDVARKGSYIMLYTTPDRHSRLFKYFEPKFTHTGLYSIKFSGLTLQFTPKQILLFGESEDQSLIDWAKEHQLRINVGMCAEAADTYKAHYNKLMGAVRIFMDQDGRNLVEDRREEAKKIVEGMRDTEGEARTIGDHGYNYPPHYDDYGPPE